MIRKFKIKPNTVFQFAAPSRNDIGEKLYGAAREGDIITVDTTAYTVDVSYGGEFISTYNYPESVLEAFSQGMLEEIT
jgi:hypothetical protein